VRGDEQEEAWRWVEPILRAWERDASPLPTYPAGSAGPVVAGEAFVGV
jgi:glucose-6-phosphate 1-dehydrogenase